MIKINFSAHFSSRWENEGVKCCLKTFQPISFLRKLRKDPIFLSHRENIMQSVKHFIPCILSTGKIEFSIMQLFWILILYLVPLPQLRKKIEYWKETKSWWGEAVSLFTWALRVKWICGCFVSGSPDYCLDGKCKKGRCPLAGGRGKKWHSLLPSSGSIDFCYSDLVALAVLEVQSSPNGTYLYN